MDEQQSINKKIANQIPVIVQKSVQEQSKKPKRKGFLGQLGERDPDSSHDADVNSS
jgi:hypothetical protein